MQGYNCIMVFDRNKENILCCKRLWDPYEGKFNLVGGKIDECEEGFHAAYRELYEETGIKKEDIELTHMMDFTYYNQNCYVEVYVGTLEKEVDLIPEEHPLHWISVDENLFDLDAFAGEGNIGHMLQQVWDYGVGLKKSK